MSDRRVDTAQFIIWIDALRAGRTEARAGLLEHARERLHRLASQMVRRFPRVRQWVETEDVLQNATLRLLRALDDIQPATAREFFGLASLQIRRELLDLARQLSGPACSAQLPQGWHSESAALDITDETFDPAALAEWTEFHEHVGTLPDELREVVDLVFYQGLSQPDAAELLGVSVRTIQRRWNSARVRLHERLQGESPER